MLPFIFKHAGYMVCFWTLLFMSVLCYFCSKLIFETTRLYPGNYRIKKSIDFETLLSANLTSKSLAVGFSKHLLLLMLISYSAIGIIFASYTTDNMI